MELSAVILAGGESSRMGRDKAWVELDGLPLIVHAVRKVRSLGAAEVFISGRFDQDYTALDCPVLHDLEPGFGPMGGIERGLHECASPLLLVLAIDMPGMTVDFLKSLQSRCDRLTGAVPKLHGELEPMAAIYPKRCHAIATGAISMSRHSARDFARACIRELAVKVFSVPASEAGCFVNWNNPDDLAQ